MPTIDSIEMRYRPRIPEVLSVRATDSQCELFAADQIVRINIVRINAPSAVPCTSPRISLLPCDHVGVESWTVSDSSVNRTRYEEEGFITE